MEQYIENLGEMNETTWLRMNFELQTKRLIDTMIYKNTLEMKNKYYKNKLLEFQREHRRLMSVSASQSALYSALQYSNLHFPRNYYKTDLDMLHDSMVTFEPSYRYL
jgi:hypothetical protein